MKKESDGKNKVLIAIKENMQIKITTQNKSGKRTLDRSILASRL